jgi:peptidyl-prolyl cis-trans isomerase SurA
MNKCTTLLLTFTVAMPLMAQQPTHAPASSPQTSAPQNAGPNSLPTAGKDETVVEEIVARVNQSIVTREDLRRSREQMIQEVRQQQSGADPTLAIAEREKNLLRDLIDQQLLVQKGTDLGFSVDTELVKRLDDLRKEMKAESIDDLEKIAQQQGVSFEDFKQNMKNNLMTQKVISSEVGGRIQFTREEIQKYYDEHKKEFDLPERIRLAEILIPATPPSQAKDDKGNPLPQMDPTPEQVAAARTKADEAMAKLKAGTKWQEVAKEYSSGPTAQEGGDLGYFKRGLLDKSLEDKTFALKEGETTGVVRTKQGFVILKVLEHSPAGVPPLSKMENRIQEVLYFQKIDPALREYLTKLRDDAYIDIKPGYVDTGASPNQTKLIYTSAPESKGKDLSKKKKKKFLIF